MSSFGKLVDEGGELSSFLLEESESLLVEYVPFEYDFNMTAPFLAMSDGVVESSGMLVVSIRKSSSVASELN